MRCAVLGSPIAHSLSPAMHRAAYVRLGLDWSYDAIRVQQGDLAEFVRGLDDQWRGLSVTMPLKPEAAQFAQDRTEAVELLGVANTLVARSDGWWADNTDVSGAIVALREAGIDALTTARIVGAGATAASFLCAVHRLGATTVDVVLRDPAKSVGLLDLAERLGIELTVSPLHDPVVDSVDLLVNTAPPNAVTGREHEFVGAAAALFEVIYDPWPTPLLQAAQGAGIAALTGIDLLAHQAAQQVFLMTGDAVDPQFLRTVALEVVDSR